MRPVFSSSAFQAAQQVEVAHDDKRFVLRTPTTGCAGKLFQISASPCRPTSATPPRTPSKPSPKPHKRSAKNLIDP
jgi:hypothetical protein